MKDHHGSKNREVDSVMNSCWSRYTELIRLCFQHKWIASLGAVSTVLCTPLHSSMINDKLLETDGDTHTHTLEILCTELNAVPHAGLGFHFLRVPVRTIGA